MKFRTLQERLLRVATPEQIATFLTDPANFLIGLDLQQGQFQFIHMPRQEISSRAFLDTRAIGPQHKRAVLPGEAVLQAVQNGPFNQQTLKANYLFHTSFCCSTLIARCLDSSGINLSLKEPYALLGLSGFKRRSKNFDPLGELWENWCGLTLRLLSRPHLPGEKILLKPSNGANNILPEILKYPGTGNVVLLYSSLEYFLAAVISGGQDRSAYVSSILQLFIKDFGAGLDIPDPESMTPLQQAGLVWALQMRNFDASSKSAPDKVRTLNCERFLDDPLECLVLLDNFYGLGFGRENLQAVVSSPVLMMHSKEPGKKYSPMAQNKETKKVIRDHKNEMAEIAKWCGNLNLDFYQGLSNPL